MYKVQNITKGKVILGDLGVSFNYGEVKDLDEQFPRHVIEGSQNLKAAIHYGKLSLPLKDEIVKEPQTTTVFMPPQSEVTQVQLTEMEQRIKSHVEKFMQQAKAANPQPQATVPHDLQDKLDQLIKVIANGLPIQSTNSHSDNTESQEDDDKLIDIQVKKLQMLTRNSEGQIAAKEEQKDSSVADRANELEDLL